MKKVPRAILPGILALVLLLAGCSARSEPVGAQPGEQAPDFQLQNLDGQDVSLSGLRGKPVLINFWAIRCPPCRDEMPYIQQIYEEWSDKGLMLLAINISEGPSEVEEFMRGNNLTLPVLLDTKEAAAQMYNVTAIPTTFFIDRDGIIQEQVVGAFQSKEQILRYLAEIIP